MSNFIFLQKDWSEIYSESFEAEKLAIVSPKASAILSRSALEFTINWLYDNDSALTKPFNDNLSSLIHEPCFRDIIEPSMFREINLIRLVGNNAAHGNKVTQTESISALKNLFRFTCFLAIYYSRIEPQITPFNDSLIPEGKESEKSSPALQELVQELNQKSEEAQKEREKVIEQAKLIEELKKQIETQKHEFTERRQKKEKIKPVETNIPLLISEHQTRKIYIDLLLKESGWSNLRQDWELEYPVIGMPLSTNPSDKGYIDYVLWGDNGKPLAVIEAKKTLYDAKKGKHQAELYADCLEKMHNQRPIIFYTNGFETYIWDDQFYNERPVNGFYTKDELQLLINRRKSRQDLRNFKVDTKIAGRPYQMQAVKRVAENLIITDSKGMLKGTNRASLLVMATGSGKTRTAAAIVDMLTKCNWVKRVLFLADRNALVTQAKNAFNEYLPNLSSIDLTKEKEDNGTRMVFSTYPTIMNKIDKVKSNDNRFYGVGHFDLIIIDEAHRSVYQKYGAIFDYFDSLLIGLTATPRIEIDRNTYNLFGIEDNNPTSAYELDEAIQQKYLVPLKSISLPIKLPLENIKYNDLSEEEKRHYEDTFGDPTIEEAPDEISGDKINKWIFNIDTVDKVLDYLMTNGIKVQNGDKLGKTIIFARNKKHALFIEKRFNINYPEYSGKFLRVIAHGEDKAQDLLENFVDKYVEKDPQIAVSIDMTDTGVDAPRVVNLVFFKQIRSLTKFSQMIGRGTRLCENFFGIGKHKTHFLIFDFDNNFAYFEQNPEGVESKTVKSITQTIFEAKLEIAYLLRNNPDKTDEESILAEKYIDELYRSIATLDHNRFVVKQNLRYVVEFSNKSSWENLSHADTQNIYTNLSNLILPDPNDDESAKRFDLLMVRYQLELLEGSNRISNYTNRVFSTARALTKKQNIPAVGNKIVLIRELQTDRYWQSINVKRLEEIRQSLRDLIKFLDKDEQPHIYTNFQDELMVEQITVRENVTNYSSLQPYRERVESYIRNNPLNMTIHKINTNRPITKEDLNELERILFDSKEIGTKDDYIKEYGDQPLGKFIRSIVGLDTQSANEAFSDFIQAGNLRSDQMTFINNIITYLNKNGTIEKNMLFEPPFTNINDQGLMGVFDDAEANKVIRIINTVNQNADIA